MGCNNIDRVHNCTKCNFSYSDTEIFRNTTDLNITKVACNVLWMNKISSYSKSNQENYKVNVSCIGNISVDIIWDNNIAIDVCINLLKVCHQTFGRLSFRLIGESKDASYA